MNIERSILKPFCRTAICIISIVCISVGFSFGGALASNCQGSADCLVCAELPHWHVVGKAANMENPGGCQPGGQNSTCGFEASQDPDEFHGIVSSARSYHQAYSGIFAATADGYGQFRVSGEVISQFPLSDSGGQAPIYLLNQSLLC